MGILARRLAEYSETRTAPGPVEDDEAGLPARSTAAGVRVSARSSLQLSAVWACVRLLTNTVASLPAEIVVSIGTRRFVEYDRPAWLVAPDPADPTMTTAEHFAQLTTSLLLDGNFFVYVEGGVDAPRRLLVLDPRRVEVRVDEGRLHYPVRDERGVVVADVAPEAMLHGTWIRLPGAARGLSPIDAARSGIGLGLAAESFGARFFGAGAALSFGVEYPGELSPEQRTEFSESLRRRHEGTSNSHAIGILTRGAKFVTGLGVSNEQSQFLETRKFTVEDIAGRIFGVPPHMVGSQEPGASSYNSVEQRSLEFRQYSVLGLVRRIEDPYQRLVRVPAAIADPRARAAFRLNIEGLARADMASRYAAYASGIEKGFVTPNEARALEDLPPLEGGDTLYMQAQMAPLGAVVPPARTAADEPAVTVIVPEPRPRRRSIVRDAAGLITEIVEQPAAST